MTEQSEVGKANEKCKNSEKGIPCEKKVDKFKFELYGRLGTNDMLKQTKQMYFAKTNILQPRIA